MLSSVIQLSATEYDVISVCRPLGHRALADQRFDDSLFLWDCDERESNARFIADFVPWLGQVIGIKSARCTVLQEWPEQLYTLQMS